MKVPTKISNIYFKLKCKLILFKDNYLYRWFPRIEEFIKFRQGKTIKSWSPSRKRYFYDYPMNNPEDIVVVPSVYFRGRQRAIEKRDVYKDNIIYLVKDGRKSFYISNVEEKSVFGHSSVRVIEADSLEKIKELLDDK